MPDNQDEAHMKIERSLKDIDWSAITANRKYYKSPAAWEDQVLYFLLLDRFSNGKEYGGFADLNGAPVTGPTDERTTPLFQDVDAGQANRQTWWEAGKTWCGGNLVGLRDKLSYLKRMGVTAVWLSPVFKQVTNSKDYHGYGVQNFLDIDPHFGTREDLRDFVAAAHSLGIWVILDIILNHAGDVFAYEGNHRYYYYQGQEWTVQGFRRQKDDPGTLLFGPNPEAWPHGAIWPSEFQDPATWTHQGEIRDQGWDSFPEYLDGDFLSLKDIDHGPAPKDPAIAWDFLRRIREFKPSSALVHLTEVYKFWIAYADIDGFRIDTVKHMEPGAVRFFTNVIHEFAQSLGKEDFYLIGEVTGGRANAVTTVDTTGINAALGINDMPDKLEFLVKGWRSPGHPETEAQEGYFDLFRNSLQDNKNTHQWYIKHVVTMFDDHDQVGVKRKFRFCGGPGDSYRFLKAALGLNLTTTGIPCLYYGTEQAFNGADFRSRHEPDDYSDVFLRECMFGGPFGSFQSTCRHFFNEDHEVYRFIQEVCELRRQHMALRRGRQYLREFSSSGEDDDFYYPQPIDVIIWISNQPLTVGELRWVVAWSRIFADQEYLCAINTDPNQPLTVWATIDKNLNPPGRSQKVCLMSTDSGQRNARAQVHAKNGSAIQITVPPAGFVVYH
jgi:glycosidase